MPKVLISLPDFLYAELIKFDHPSLYIQNLLAEKFGKMTELKEYRFRHGNRIYGRKQPR